ncbi:MAG: SapC family protein [Telluria sp.]
MSHHVLLNNIDHKDLRIATARSATYGDDVMLAITFPAEFRDLQAHYPIVFRKTPDGTGFEPVVLFGFQERENLFLGPTGWDASYVPLAIERQPFLIGITNGEPLVHIDLDSPRVRRDDGEAVFLAHGGNTEFLERVNSTLLSIYQGVQATPPFIAALREHGLLESFVVDIELDDGSQNRLAGFYTINEDKLNALGGQAVATLHQTGYLQAIYMVVASMSNFRALINRRNGRHA